MVQDAWSDNTSLLQSLERFFWMVTKYIAVSLPSLASFNSNKSVLLFFFSFLGSQHKKKKIKERLEKQAEGIQKITCPNSSQLLLCVRSSSLGDYLVSVSYFARTFSTLDLMSIWCKCSLDCVTQTAQAPPHSGTHLSILYVFPFQPHSSCTSFTPWHEVGTLILAYATILKLISPWSQLKPTNHKPEEMI